MGFHDKGGLKIAPQGWEQHPDMTLTDIHGGRAVAGVTVDGRVGEHALGRVDAEQIEQMLRFGRHVWLQQDAAEPEGLGAGVDDLIQLLLRGIFVHQIPGRGFLHEPVRLCSAQRLLDFFFPGQQFWGGGVFQIKRSKSYEPIEPHLEWILRLHRSLAPPSFSRLSKVAPPGVSSVIERPRFDP